VTGTVRLKLYKGNTTVVGRKSPKSLYSMQHVTFEDDAGADVLLPLQPVSDTAAAMAAAMPATTV